jgi:hypothetical protein
MVASDIVEEADTWASPQPIMESWSLRVASDSVEEADMQASPQQIMKSSPLRVTSDSDSGATTVPVNKTAAPIQSNAHLKCRIYHVWRQEVATGGAAATTITRRQNSSTYTESKAHTTVSSVRRSIHGPIPAKVNQVANHKGYRYGMSSSRHRCVEARYSPGKKSHPKVHHRKKCKVTSHADSGGLAPVNGYLGRENLNTGRR